jgi:exoribonuclease R
VPWRSINVHSGDSEGFREAVRRIEDELGLPQDFPPEVVAEAEEASRRPTMPDLDRTDLPFITIDPPGATDLDQALHIARNGSGYRVFYAIADVSAFVRPGGLIDQEAHRRGQTLYTPEHRLPLHPPVLSEGAASLLPDQVRPALLWIIDVDSTGEQTKVDVVRARVRSRAQLDYASAQAHLTTGSGDDVLALLREVGTLRLEQERARGGVSLPLPDQEVVISSGRWSLTYRASLPIEEWNAQISLLTGMGAAEIMLYGEVGIVRTLPTPPDSAFAKLRRAASAVHLEWDPDVDYPDFIRSLDPSSSNGAAMLNACTSLLRGAGYVAFEGGVPQNVEHAALASEYAHVTAPLRRLADRYAGEVAVALCADSEIPEWVRTALRDLPKEMETSDRIARRLERAVLDHVEAGVLAGRLGETFTGVITDLDDRDESAGIVMLREPAVEAKVSTATGRLPLGEEVTVRLVKADRDKRVVRFELMPVTP